MKTKYLAKHRKHSTTEKLLDTVLEKLPQLPPQQHVELAMIPARLSLCKSAVRSLLPWSCIWQYEESQYHFAQHRGEALVLILQPKL